MIKVAVVGMGFMGQTHCACLGRNPLAQLVAVGVPDPGKLASGAAVQGNIGENRALDLSNVRVTGDIEALICDPDIDVLDFCVPTRQHAAYCVAALKAGKHVLCEKPLAWTSEECDAIIEAQLQSGKALMVGHCLRFWPQYLRAHELIESGDLGEMLYARLHRVGGAPTWSRWLMDATQSGGAVLDMHVHDIDTALWWFGCPASVQTSGLIVEGLPLRVDSLWTFEGGPQVHLHGGWDKNISSFTMGFELVGTLASLMWDSSKGETMQLWNRGQLSEIEVNAESAYQLEIDYFLECLKRGELPSRITPQDARASVQMARDELKQMGFEG